MVFVIFVWLALCFAAGAIAKNKGRSFAGFFWLSFFLSPLVGILAAAIARPNVANVELSQIQSGDRRKCPYCAEIIKREATVCRYCGKDLPPVPPIVSNVVAPLQITRGHQRSDRLYLGLLVLVAVVIVLWGAYWVNHNS
jgi:hypothetical protein